MPRANTREFHLSGQRKIELTSGLQSREIKHKRTMALCELEDHDTACWLLSVARSPLLVESQYDGGVLFLIQIFVRAVELVVGSDIRYGRSRELQLWKRGRNGEVGGHGRKGVLRGS